MIEFSQHPNRLICCADGEILEVEAWGQNAVRVRATTGNEIRRDWVQALLPAGEQQATIEIGVSGATLRNGAMEAQVSQRGELAFVNRPEGKLLLKEKAVNNLSVPARSYKDLQGGLFHIDCNFEAYEDEHLYGLGQHQHGRLDQKGCVIELIQRNTEVSIPFLLSNRGYGFLWNNPAVGRVELGLNATRWVAEAAPQIDYWITTGNSPAGILAAYADATGHAPQFPEWASSFWQSRLRYTSQDELERVAREYHERGLPCSVIVVDFFHWTRHGEWQFDPQRWPDPAGMVQRLKVLGIQVMVSVWPTVSRLSSNFVEMWSKNFIIRNKFGSAAQMYFVDNGSENGLYLHYYDSTHPGARKYIWDKVKNGYFRHGIKIFWLDACEPEMIPFMPENLLFHAGDGEAVANCYPLDHVRGFYEGMLAEGERSPLFLCRSAWAGSQRYGAAVWSGDIPSTFPALRAQVKAGLNMGLSGIPWWTADIGGFRGGDPASEEFQQLIVRWFQFGALCPIFRLHGHRLPAHDDFSGGPNEVWSFGETAYQAIREIMDLRERLRPYIHEQMRETSRSGLPIMRPLFIDFPSDLICYQVEDEYLFGSDLLVAPVLDANTYERRVYLPLGGTWKDAWANVIHEGGQWFDVEAPLNRIPLFLKGDANLPIRTSGEVRV